MTDDITHAASPIADGDCVRFTVFFDVRGPQVFEISADALIRVFGAAGRSSDLLLAAFERHEAAIVAAARACHGANRSACRVIRLEAADFPAGAA